VIAQRVLAMLGRTGQPPMNVYDRSERRYRPICQGDIVILLRSMKFKADPIALVLREAGIAVHSESATGYFEATEVNDVLSLLQVLDNQRQDIPLAAVLRSPIANLPQADDQLARMRLAYLGEPPVSFHEAAARYAAEQNDDLAKRLRDFRAQLDAWRTLARQRPLAEVLWTIYDQTGYLAFCAGLAGGEQRQANLIELHERARQFGTFRRQGLSRFLQFLEKLKSDSDLGQASIASEAEDVVRIMSIHRSKGLEFPVVVLPDLGKAFNLQDCQGSILLDRHIGIGMQVVDEQRCVRYPSLASTVVQQRLRQQSLAEELRVLYVAMTRAKEHLILIGSADADSNEQWLSRWTSHRGALPVEAALGARSMLDWIGPVAAMLAAGSMPSFDLFQHTLDEVREWVQSQRTSPELTPLQASLAELKPLDPPPPPDSSGAAADVIDRMSAVYPFKEFTTLAAAASVTSRTKSAAATAAHAPHDVAIAADPALELDRLLARPAFLAGALPPDAADRGTATHAVLEWLDFTRANNASQVREQIEKLVAARRLPAAHAQLVDVGAILWLMQHEVGQLLRDSGPGLLREAPIYLAGAAPTSSSNDPNDQVMIRGRIDTLVPSSGGYVLIDYKTDNVTGDALEQRAIFYKGQLELYRHAIERMTRKPVTRAILVFLSARECRTVYTAAADAGF
jgi:ATP-dependent helicase/nuclease subunit A